MPTLAEEEMRLGLKQDVKEPETARHLGRPLNSEFYKNDLDPRTIRRRYRRCTSKLWGFLFCKLP